MKIDEKLKKIIVTKNKYKNNEYKIIDKHHRMKVMNSIFHGWKYKSEHKKRIKTHTGITKKF